ncbi:MAG: hypothetical protein LUQ66_06555 [Methanoregula sp.]|nr:hypothetical protein [Methanoregula sp.]
MRRVLLVYGAGAIGRGYLPWVFSPQEFDYYYVETNPAIANLINTQKQFTTCRIRNGAYECMTVPVVQCFRPGEETAVIDKADAIVTAVGPRNIYPLSESIKGTTKPVICCENDASIPSLITTLTGNPNVVFAIPDVITSNTAPPELLNKDPLSIVTEDGTCYIDERVSYLGGNCIYINQDELSKQWMAKLYLHNTPHCIAAYLGYILQVNYLHESMKNPHVDRIVTGAMNEMQQLLAKKFFIDQQFIGWYADKELQRFRNSLLFDPISRVAREPFRKLAPNERLIGAAQLCVSCGIIPQNILLGIMAAFCYDNPADPDVNIKYLMDSLAPKDFLRIAMQLRPGEALYELLLKRWDNDIGTLRNLNDI